MTTYQRTQLSIVASDSRDSRRLTPGFCAIRAVKKPTCAALLLTLAEIVQSGRIGMEARDRPPFHTTMKSCNQPHPSFYQIISCLLVQNDAVHRHSSRTFSHIMGCWEGLSSVSVRAVRAWSPTCACRVGKKDKNRSAGASILPACQPPYRCSLSYFCARGPPGSWRATGTTAAATGARGSRPHGPCLLQCRC